MRAAQISEYGDANVLKVTDTAPKPPLGDDQVLVAVHAAGVNPFDVKVRDGSARSMAELDFPATLGGDFAGVIAELGEGVTGLEVGQEVYGQAGALSGHGSFAEFTPVKSTSVAAKPASTDFIQAAAYPLVSVSAYQALVEHMKLEPSQKILIHGGAGGIGSMAIQLAKHLGVYVITTAVADDTDYVTSLGADEVIDYTTHDFVSLVTGLDAVYDTVGGETNIKSYGVLKPGGTLVSMVSPVDEALAAQYEVSYVQQFTHVTPEKLQAITGMIEAGDLTVRVDKVFPFDQAAEALEYLKTGHPKGKVVIQVKE